MGCRFSAFWLSCFPSINTPPRGGCQGIPHSTRTFHGQGGQSSGAVRHALRTKLRRHLPGCHQHHQHGVVNHGQTRRCQVFCGELVAFFCVGALKKWCHLRLLLMKRKGNSKLLYTVCNPREAFLVEKLTLDLILFRKFKRERKATLCHTIQDKTIRTYKVHQSISKLKHVPSCNSTLTLSPSTLLAPPLLPPPTP